MAVVSVEQAAEISGLHPQTLREHLRAGRLKAMRIGRVYVIDEADLHAFMATRKKPGRPRKDQAK